MKKEKNNNESEQMYNIQKQWSLHIRWESGNGSADKEIDYKMLGPTMSMK